jgi:hypothetical protein
VSPKRGELTGLKLQYRVALGRHRRDNYVRRNVRMVRLPSTSGRACSPPFHTQLGSCTAQDAPRSRLHLHTLLRSLLRASVVAGLSV